MKLSTFELVSVDRWCKEVNDPAEMWPPIASNIMYRHHEGGTYAVDPPDFYIDAADIEGIENPEPFFGYKKVGAGFEITDVFMAYLEDVNIMNINFMPILVDEHLVFAESVYNTSTWEMFLEAGVLSSAYFHQIYVTATQNNESQQVPVKIHAHLEPDHVIEEPCVMLANTNNYFHWITESVGRMWSFEVFPHLAELPLIVPGRPGPFILETLEAMNLNTKNLIHLQGMMTKVQKLHFPSLQASCGFSERMLDWVRDKLLNTFGIPVQDKASKRYYITRRDAPGRRVINEDAVTEYLGKFGFETVCPGKLSVREQIETFSKAEIVVAPHGAGTTNFIFAPKGATLVEFIPKSYRHPMWWMITKLGGQRYGRLICDDLLPGSDMYVKPERLDKLMKQVFDS